MYFDKLSKVIGDFFNLSKYTECSLSKHNRLDIDPSSVGTSCSLVSITSDFALVAMPVGSVPTPSSPASMGGNYSFIHQRKYFISDM